MMEEIFNESKSKLDEIAVTLLEESVNEILSTKDSVVIGLCGGESVQGFYNLLKKSKLPWSKIHIFMVDERLVDLKHKDSNYRMVYGEFIYKIENSKLISPENLHPFLVSKDKEDKGLADYKDELEIWGGSFDIVILSSGEDGHVASLFPDMSVKDRSDSFILVNNSPKLPKGRITASRKLIQKSSVAFLFFIGEEKKGALEKFYDEKISEIKCPAPGPPINP
ncbi:6-phosphogluconolactonase [Nanoarchaeota archaeon]